MVEIGHNVYARYAGNGIHVHVVVHQTSTVSVGEELSVAKGGCQFPHLVDDMVGKVHADLLTCKGGTTASHHVQQDAIAGIVAYLSHLLCPHLAAQAPCVLVILQRFCPFRCAHVLGIKAYEVYAQIAHGLLLDEACYLYHHRHAAGTVVGTEDGLLVVGLIGVVICPWTCVPVGTQQYPVFCLGVGAGYDVTAWHGGSVPHGHLGLLFAYHTALALELGLYPFGTQVGLLGAKQTGAKGTLLLYVTESTVCHELGAWLVGRHTALLLLLCASAGNGNHGYRYNQ